MSLASPESPRTNATPDHIIQEGDMSVVVQDLGVNILDAQVKSYWKRRMLPSQQAFDRERRIKADDSVDLGPCHVDVFQNPVVVRLDCLDSHRQEEILLGEEFPLAGKLHIERKPMV